MKEIIYSGLKILALFLIAVVIINDVGVLIMTQIGASDMAQLVVNGAVSSYKTSHSPAEAQLTAEEIAHQRGMNLTYFNMSNAEITATVEVPPRKTFIIHRIKSLESYLTASVTASADIESPR